MEKHFNHFLKKMGPAIDCRPATDEVLARYRGKLPDQLLSYWREYGWCGYGQGAFWIVNPDDYEEALQSWLRTWPERESDNYYVFARSAFGQLFVWSTKRGYKLSVVPTENKVLPDPYAPTTDVDGETLEQYFRSYVSGTSMNRCDTFADDGKRLFSRAVKKLGPVAYDETYSFKLAPVLGGPRTLDNLHKVKIHEQLAILADLATPEVVDLSKAY